MSISEMIESLKKQKITMGEPWKLPNASGFLIPLIIDSSITERNYILLQEVEDKVEFRDSGGISGVDAKNNTGKNVYIRKGTMLKGTGTQSRAPITSYVLTPEKTYKRIPVNCIHQSHGINSGSSFKAMGVAPIEVYTALGEQSSTWASISEYSSKLRAAMPSINIREDNLVGVEDTIQENDNIVDALKNIPGDHVNQIGVAVFDFKGVVAIELFNHPDSCKTFSESIIRSYRGVLTEETGELIEIRTDKAATVLKKYLDSLSSLKRTVLNENKISKVWDLRDRIVEGELTEVEGVEIHLTLNRISDKPKPTLNYNQRLRPITLKEDIQEIREAALQLDVNQEEFVQKRGGYNILAQLAQTPQRFSELLEKVDVSRGTLASRIREAEEIGLIEKGIRKSNGSPSYTLTEEGEKTKQEVDKKAK